MCRGCLTRTGAHHDRVPWRPVRVRVVGGVLLGAAGVVGGVMSEVIDRAKAALEGVTEGPWRTDGTLIGCDLIVESPGITSYKYAIANMDEDAYDEEDGEGDYGDGMVYRPFESMSVDAEFIAASRTLIPDLIAELEATQRLLDDLTASDIGEVTAHRDELWAERNALLQKNAALHAEVARLGGGVR